MKYSKAVIGAVSAVLLLAVQGCSSGSESGSSDAQGKVDTEASIRVQGLIGPGSFDPIKQTHAAIASAMLGPVYDTLVALDPDLNVVGRVATKFAVADDGLSASATLRDDVKFWDGNLVDATAVKANFDRAQTKDSLISAFYPTLKETTVVSPTEVTFTFDAPTYNFFETLATNPALDSIANPAEFKNPELGTKGFGSGAFKVKSVTGTTDVAYERVGAAGDYWDKGAAQYKNLSFQLVPDDNARLNALRSGQADIIFGSAGQQSAVRPLVKAKTIQQAEYRNLQQLVMYLNFKNPALKDERVRKALSLALDRRGVVAATNDGCVASASLWPEGVEGESEEFRAEKATTPDVDAAKALLADAGFPNLKLSVIIPNASTYTTAVQVLQQTLKKVGITLTTSIVPPPDAPRQFGAGDFDIYFTIAGAAVDPFSLISNTTVAAPLADPPAYLEAPLATVKDQKLGTEESKTAWTAIDKLLVDRPANAIAVCQPINFQPGSTKVRGLDKMAYSFLGGVPDTRYLAISR